jgi:GT2 family glycosyltransferase
MSNSLSIGIIVVSYRNNRELVAFLQHLDGFPDDLIGSTVATANGLDPAAVAALQTDTVALLRGRIQLVAGAQNPGYFGGAALALRQWQARGQIPDWVIVTNDDIRFASDFFKRLAAYAATGVAVLAPDIVVPITGLHQNPLYTSKPPAWRIRLLRWLHQHPTIMQLFVGLREFRQHWRKRQKPAGTGSRVIYAPHGACIVFSRAYFAAGGNLDYPCFLYGEEFFVAETARRLGLDIRVEPTLQVTHHEHSTTGLLAPASMARPVHDSLGFLLREYYRD